MVVNVPSEAGNVFAGTRKGIVVDSSCLDTAWGRFSDSDCASIVVDVPSEAGNVLVEALLVAVGIK